MENKVLTRAYLDTLSNADLISLADDYGIDIPENLNRRFIIAELIEISLEFAEDDISEMTEKQEDVEEDYDLPKSFNETQIDVVLRNPAWVYVFWDISENDFQKATESARFKNFVLRVSFFEDEDDTKPVKTFDITVGNDVRDQYILLDNGHDSCKKILRIDLIALYTGKDDDILSVSGKIVLPEFSEVLDKAHPGTEIEISPILELSGLKKLLKNHYKKYRQSFSE